MSHIYKQSGFTWLEMVIVIALIGILSTIAVPSMGALFAKNALRSAKVSVSDTMRTARSYAITQQLRTVICPSADGELCSNGLTWNKALIVFVDLDSNYSRSTNEALVSSVKKQGNSVTVIPDQTDNAYAFLPNGEMRGSNGSRSVTYTVSDDKVATNKNYELKMTRIGSIATTAVNAP